jgi:hypothetical protein
MGMMHCKVYIKRRTLIFRRAHPLSWILCLCWLSSTRGTTTTRRAKEEGQEVKLYTTTAAPPHRGRLSSLGRHVCINMDKLHLYLPTVIFSQTSCVMLYINSPWCIASWCLVLSVVTCSCNGNSSSLVGCIHACYFLWWSPVLMYEFTHMLENAYYHRYYTWLRWWHVLVKIHVPEFLACMFNKTIN